MFKVLIVDDEPLFREYLRTIMNWETYGFVLCGEAKNGLEALQTADETLPDLALVDVNMPLMDGLELSKQLKAKYPDMSIVMVTGYGEFEYARNALKIGVEDYILKPFDPDELFLTLVRVKSHLQKIYDTKKVHRDQSHSLREQFLNMLISQDITLSDLEISTQLERFSISNVTDRFVVVTVEIDNLYQRWNDNKEILLWKNTICNVLNEIITWEGHNLVFFGPEDRIISLFTLGSEQVNPLDELDSLQRLCDLVKRHFKFTVTLGVGRPNYGFKGIRKSYMEALAALHSKITVGNGKVICYQESDKMTQGFYSSEINEKMLLALRLNDYPEIKKRLDEVFQYIREQRLTADMAYIIVIGLVSLCLSHIVASGHHVATVLGAEFSPYQEIKRQENLETTYHWLEEIINKTLKLNDERNRPTRSKEIFVEAKQLIEQNYQNPILNVEEITKLTFINGSYLRKIFNKEAAMSISDYITYVRMQRAKEFIQMKKANIATISKMVGYNDAGYFSKCFKKYYGCTPSEYEGQI
jgi:two-component system response regulator YesN